MGRNNKCKYQVNCAFSFKRKRTARNKRKYKTMTLDTQLNLVENDKSSFYNQKECLEKSTGRECFIVNMVMTSRRLLLYF